MLVLGAAGGIGLSAIELGKAFGLTVVAAVSSEAKAEAARAAGADADPGLSRRGRSTRTRRRRWPARSRPPRVPAGFDIVFDPVGGDYAEPALRSLGWEGRYLVIGFPAGHPENPAQPDLAQELRHPRRLLGRVRDARSRRPTTPMSTACSSCGARARSGRGSARPTRSSAPARRSPRCATARRWANWSSPFDRARWRLLFWAALHLRLRHGGPAAPAAPARRSRRQDPAHHRLRHARLPWPLRVSRSCGDWRLLAGLSLFGAVIELVQTIPDAQPRRRCRRLARRHAVGGRRPWLLRSHRR